MVLALWETWAARHDAAAVPDADWQRAAQVVRDGYRAGDLIVFAPGWTDPIGRWQLGDLIPLAVAGRMDAARYGRIWELAIRGAHADETAGLQPVFSAERGDVTVRRFERAPAVVVGDVLDLAGTATGAHPSVELAEVGFAPHRCLQVSPVPGQPLRIAFPAFPLGTQLVGYVGIADVFTRRDVRSPVTLQVELAGQVIATATAGVDDGWVRFAAMTAPGAAELVFVASASDPNRKLCFAAEARR